MRKNCARDMSVEKFSNNIFVEGVSSFTLTVRNCAEGKERRQPLNTDSNNSASKVATTLLGASWFFF